MKNIFIGIDHGGTNTTALVFDLNKGVRSCESVPMPKSTLQEGIVEHNPDDFLNTSIKASKLALDKSNLNWNDVCAVAIANQGETSMAWSKDEKRILGPAISWEDRRTEEMCKSLKVKGVDKLVRKNTGVLLDPYFSATKFKWLLENNENIAAVHKKGKLRLGTTDTYVIDRLTKGEAFVTDPGTASRTALQNIYSGKWDNDLINAFNLEERLLPKILKSIDNYGTIKHKDISSSSINISGDVVDAHAALFAHGCMDSSKIKATYGTGAFIEINTGKEMVEPDGLLPVFIGWELENGIEYTLEGGVFSVGSAIDWSKKNGFIQDINESAELAQSIKETGNLFMIPSFTGLSAPHWISSAKASIFGLGLDHSQAHITKALLDGIAFQCSEIINLLKDKKKFLVNEVCADGGPSKNKYLMQRHADLLGIQVSVSKEKNMTAYGAALLAAYGSKQITLNDLKKFKVEYETFEPKISDDERESLWEKWKRNINLIKNIYKNEN